tara:strand:- start:64411 stop:64968 length:558 start_codon:yes stop_codon:yes gene_type:complete
VGSSGRLLETDFGDRIDKYAEIVRFNRAPVEGWEAKVGSKTTLRVLNRPTFASAPLLRWSDDIEFAKKIKDSRILVGAHTQGLVKARDKYVDPSNELYVFNHGKVVQAAHKAKYILTSPTIGFQIVFLLVAAGLKPHLYGFDFEEGRPRDHYWHERPPGSWSHNLEAEMKVMRDLVSKGKVNLIQ